MISVWQIVNGQVIKLGNVTIPSKKTSSASLKKTAKCVSNLRTEGSVKRDKSIVNKLSSECLYSSLV